MSEVQVTSRASEVSPVVAGAPPETLTLLKKLPLFASLPEGDLAALARVAKKQIYAPNDREHGTIFSYDDPGDAVYFVTSGKVEIFVINKAGTKLPLVTEEEGAFFGEVGMLIDSKRTASAVALSPTVVLEVSRDNLLSLLHAHPEIMLTLFRETARRLGRNSANLQESTIVNPNERIKQQIPAHEMRLHRLAHLLGSPRFLYGITIFVAAWMGLLWACGTRLLDGPAFNALILILAVVPIVVTSIVLHSENLQARREEIRNDVLTQTNVNAEREIRHLHTKLDELRSELKQHSWEAARMQNQASTAPTSEERHP